MKSVMITGCAGFIGSHVTEVFLEAGYNIIGVDAMTYALQETILFYGVAAAP